jgi:hypothetical protein
MRIARITTVGAFVFASAACGDKNDPTALARVGQVILSPADTTVEHPATFRYRVTLLDDAGDPIDDGIDRPMDFTAENDAVINVTDGGFVTTETAGVTEVRARVGGTLGTAELTVH